MTEDTEAHVRKLLEPIAASMGQSSRNPGAAFDSQVERDAQKAGLEVAVQCITALLSTAESLRTIARVLEADATAPRD